MKELIEDKTVAVVGNARSLNDKNLGEFIDSHDIVIRFNQGTYHNRPKSHGIKCDIAFLNNPDIWNIDKIKCKNLALVHTKKKRSSFIHLPEKNEEEIKEKLKVERPSSGAYVLNYLTHCNCKVVNLFGFDWMSTTNWYSKRTKNPHNFKREQEYFINLIKSLPNWNLY